MDRPVNWWLDDASTDGLTALRLDGAVLQVGPATLTDDADEVAAVLARRPVGSCGCRIRAHHASTSAAASLSSRACRVPWLCARSTAPPDVGEFELIARLAPYLATAGPGVLVGNGDDAAVLAFGDRGAVLAVDVIVEGVHFRRDTSSLADVGWKALAVNCSDLAAMAAQPRAAVVGLLRPAALAADDVEALYQGLAAAAETYGVALVGGDTVAASQLAVSVTLLGEVAPTGIVRRSGARPGDAVVVVGALGAAAAALASLDAGSRPSAAMLAAHRRPRALVAAGAVLGAYGATAMIDVSDGLGADVGHIAAASGVGVHVTAVDLPVADGVAAVAAATGADLWTLVAGGGEDFALCATLPAAAAHAAAAAAGAADGVPAAVVGEVTAGGACALVLPDGTTRDLAGLGYDHYQQETS